MCQLPTYVIVENTPFWIGGVFVGITQSHFSTNILKLASRIHETVTQHARQQQHYLTKSVLLKVFSTSKRRFRRYTFHGRLSRLVTYGISGSEWKYFLLVKNVAASILSIVRLSWLITASKKVPSKLYCKTKHMLWNSTPIKLF